MDDDYDRDRDGGSAAVFLSFILGGLTGAALALLYAPRSGQETRDLLAEKYREGEARAREAKERALAKGRDALDEASGYLDKQKQNIDQRKDRFVAAVEAGRQAYKEEKQKGVWLDTVGVVFLGIIALSSLIQGALLLLLARGGLRLSKRIQDLQSRVEAEIKPILDDVNVVSRNVTLVSDLAAAQAARIQDVVAETARRVEETRDEVKAVLAHPAAALGDVLAFLKGIRRGLEVYRQLGGFEAQTRGSSRRYAEDEHLFI